MAIETVMPLQGAVHAAFATPLVLRTVPDAAGVNRALAEDVLRLRAAGPTPQSEIKGAWRSRPDLWERPGDAFESWRRWIGDAVAEMRAAAGEAPAARLEVMAWADVLADGAYVPRLCHAGHPWTAIYHVAAGGDGAGNERTGNLELFDPRPMAANDPRQAYRFGLGLTVAPDPGSLVLFPGWLEYWVRPYFGSGPRISLTAAIAPIAAVSA